MSKYLIIIFILCLGLGLYKLFKYKKIKWTKNRRLEKFKKKFNTKNRIKEKLADNYSYLLMSNPDENIKISSWNTEKEVREKADIHRARLNKYGRSKLNGAMLFMGPKGGVYKYSNTGTKKYL